MSAIDTNAGDGNEKRKCRICLVPLSLTSASRYCNQHLRQYKLRQEEQIPTDDLDPRWEDRLANWRDRPSGLARELFADRLVFMHRSGAWLIFWMGYPTRLPDWLVVRVDGTQWQRFVETDERVVLAAIGGEKVVPHQAALAIRWGHPEPWLVWYGRGPRLWPKYFGMIFKKQARLLNVIDTVPFPVYGPRSDPYGLELSDVTLRADRDQTVEIGLTLRRDHIKEWETGRGPRVTEEQAIGFSVYSEKVPMTDYEQTPSTGYSEPMSLVGSFANPDLGEHLGQLLRQATPALRDRSDEWSGDLTSHAATIYQGGLEIDHTPFTGEIVLWQRNDERAMFQFMQYSTADNVVSCISGWSSGMTIEHLIRTLQCLVPIDAYGELMIRYQTEWDRHRS